MKKETDRMGKKHKVSVIVILAFLVLVLMLVQNLFGSGVVVLLSKTLVYEENVTNINWENRDEQLSRNSDKQVSPTIKTQDTNVTNAGVNVMLFGYARGGSTYVGQMLGYNDAAFYFYEPLWTEEGGLKYYRNNFVCEMNSNSCSYKKSLNITSYLSKLQDIYGCKENTFSKLYVVDWHRKKGGLPWNTHDKLSNKTAVLQKRCLQSKSRVAKVLRVTGEILEDLLISDSTLKVVYLFRDPRGIINSRIKLRKNSHWNNTMGTVKDIADGLCTKMKMDSDIIFRLKKKFHKRIILIAYETIVKYPKTSINILFKQLGIDVSETYLSKISTMGKRSDANDRAWNSVFRSDGAAIADQWKKDLSVQDKRTIDQSCELMYNKFGYTPFQ